MTEQKPLGQFLLEEGLITQKQIDVALSVQKIEKNYLGETLLDLDFITSEEIAKAVAKQQGLDYVDIESSVIDAEVLKLVLKEVALDKKILPLWVENNTLYVATDNAQDLVTNDYLLRTTKYQVVYVICDKTKLYNMIELHYYQLENPIEKRIRSMIASYGKGNDIDVVMLLDLFLHNAIKDRATDIHITPDDKVVHIVFRIDGVLQHYYSVSKALHAQMVARVKILSSIDIAMQRLPQDGAFTYQFLDQEYDFRVSTLPTDQGENLVLRILSQASSLANLTSLGLDAGDHKLLSSFFNKPYGMVLVTGPTGSGKTTTLYSALQQIDSLSKNVLTVEDPIEYRFSFIKQTQINEKVGYTFSKAIRHFMRQDPDVLLVGEIRDQETAELAVRASITGHLVLSTLHANSAVATIPRLRDMGIADDLIATSLLAVVAQRLVRRVCHHCCVATKISKDELEALGFSTRKMESETMSIFSAKEQGCPHCKHTGYHGRSAILEMLTVDPEMKAMVANGASTHQLNEHAQKEGMLMMKEHGLKKIFEGVTTLDEVLRVTL